MLDATPAAAPRRSLPTHIIADLRARILRGEFKPGDRLPPERELAAELGTNRNTLREALRSLEGQGLVKARQGDGVRVQDFLNEAELSLLPHFLAAAPPDVLAQQMMHLMQLRTLMCEELVVWSAEHATEEDLQPLAGVLNNIEEAYNDRDSARMAAAELTLYRTLLRARGNIAMLWIFNSVEKAVIHFLGISPQVWVIPDSVVASWHKVVDAMRRHDAQTAGDTLRALHSDADALIFSTFAEGLSTE